MIEMLDKELMEFKPQTKPKLEMVELEVINPQPKPKVMELDLVELEVINAQALLPVPHMTFRPQRFVISIHHLESTRLQAPPTLMQVVFHRNRNHQKYNGINIYFGNLNNFKNPVFFKNISKNFCLYLI